MKIEKRIVMKKGQKGYLHPKVSSLLDKFNHFRGYWKKIWKKMKEKK